MQLLLKKFESHSETMQLATLFLKIWMEYHLNK